MRLPNHSALRAALVLAAVFPGVALPLDFMHQLPGTIRYASPLQVLQIFGELVWIYSAVGLGIAGVVAIMAALAGKLLRRSATDCVVATSGWVASTMLAWFVLHAIRLWLMAVGALPKALPPFLGPLWHLASIAIGTAWFAWHRRAGWHSAVRWPVHSATVGLIVAIVGVGLAAHAPLMDYRTAAAPVQAAAGGPARPDLLLVTVDTLSASHMSVYGYERDTTPGLSAWARSATVFDRFYANSNFTTSTVASILTGKRPWQHRVLLAPSTLSTADAQASLFATFRQAGYYTMAVSTNPWAEPAKHQVANQLDRYVRSRPWVQACAWDINHPMERIASAQTSAILNVLGWWNRPREILLNLAINRGWCPPSGHFDPQADFREVWQLLDQAPGTQPVLLWVHLTPPHDPYAPPPPWVGHFDPGPQARRVTDSAPNYHYLTPDAAESQKQALMGRYDEAIRFMDAHVSGFLTLVAVHPRWQHSVQLVSADHGESFQHNYAAHGGPELYESVVRIPLLIHLPGQSTAQRISTPAEQVDLLPTLSRLAGLELATQGREGRDLSALLQGGALPNRPVVTMSFEHQSIQGPLQRGTVAVVDGPWKLHLRIGHPPPEAPAMPELRLFNVVTDPGEANDLATQQPDRVAALRQIALSELARAGQSLAP